MEIPKFSIKSDTKYRSIQVEFDFGVEKDIYPIVRILYDYFCQSCIGERMTDAMQLSMRTRVENFLIDLVERNYLFKLPNNRWRVNIVEYVANQLGASVHRGKLSGLPHGAMHGIWANRTTLADCLVDRFDGELIEQMKMQPAEIIEWFAETIDQPKLHAAVDKAKEKLIVEVANIK